MLGEADMGLMDQCEALYKTSKMYDVIGVTKDASEADVRQVIIKSHYKSTLIWAPGDEQATAKFQFGKPT